MNRLKGLTKKAEAKLAKVEDELNKRKEARKCKITDPLKP